MTIPRMRDILKYQNKNPPLHIKVSSAINAYFGVSQDGETSSSKSETDEHGNSLFDMFPTAG